MSSSKETVCDVICRLPEVSIPATAVCSVAQWFVRWAAVRQPQVRIPPAPHPRPRMNYLLRRRSAQEDKQSWYAQSEILIIITHSKIIVIQDYRFWLLVFFLSLFLFTVPRRKTIVLRGSQIFLLVLLWCLKTIGGVWFLLLV